MSRILLIEPYRMLQQAIVLALFPEHQVEAVETLPDVRPAAIDGYDVAIIDVASLDEKGLSEQTIQACQTSQTPIIWVASENGSPVARRPDDVVLQRPLAREPLAAALAHCLALSSNRKAGTDEAEKGGTETLVNDATQPDRPVNESDGEIIELVDVVDDTEPAKNNQSEIKK